ncbi:PREDICTED: myotubularin-related protein 10-B [Rhagoletis zephyria]|uniref:myotubularin-related protein 10-B n=2 Tax=Rhagoletis TaxID=28609 RepID=UPI00081125ED|nr:PREDICTED: myotubularin-related protein 10-B [Rhagoletis zephyria]
MASISDRKRNTFLSYVAPSPGDIPRQEGSDDWLPTELRDLHLAKPRLLPNELVVASAPAYLFSAIMPAPTEGSELDMSRQAVFGLLSVTNFKMAFVPLQRQQQETLPQESYQEHLYLQRNDVTLNNIDYVYQLAEGGRVSVRALSGGNKRKKLDAQQKVMSSRITALHIICKNFRLLKFAFQQSRSGSDYGKLIASALARFAYPSRHDLSFAYCYREPYYSMLGKSSVTMYSTKNDWARELIRCGANEWQVVSAENVPQLQNLLQAPKYTLPPHFVIPKCCTVDRFLDLSRAFYDSRAAFWVFGYGNASLVRLAELKPAMQQDTKVENVTLELVRKCDERRTLKLLQLTDRLPSIQDVQRAYLKFRRLCTPESPQEFLMQDSKFLTNLEKSNWIFYVSLCLRYSCEAAESLRSGTTCVLQETNGRDLCCVVSSLTQIILDPLYRTIDGFQSLVQKEWIALEHPFQTRLGHVRGDAAEEEESPVFLLFLDCVWQLLQQYPDEFEYSQTYLTTLWDACFLPIFDTFQFDTEADRARAVRIGNLVLRPVWDWGEQFAEKDKVFFTNPFYQRQRQEQHNRRSIAIPAGAIMLPGLAQIPSIRQGQQQRFTTINPQLFVTSSTIPKDRYLEPQHSMADLAIWEQCYYRWMPILEIKHGGFPQIDLNHRLLLSNIAKLQRCLELQDFDDLPDIYYERTGEKRPPVDNAVKRRNSIEMIDGVERRRKTSLPATLNGVNSSVLLPEISSFFPFSINTGESEQLIDILTNSNEFLLEGSFMERLSIA